MHHNKAGNYLPERYMKEQNRYNEHYEKIYQLIGYDQQNRSGIFRFIAFHGSVLFILEVLNDILEQYPVQGHQPVKKSGIQPLEPVDTLYFRMR